jgi:hypothetical protein
MKNSRRTSVAIIALIAVLVMAAGGVAVLAQDDAPDNPALPSGRGSFHGHGGYHGRDQGANDEDLAEALGITAEELQAARQKVYADRLRQAVEDGTLTQDQANTLLAMQALKGYLDHGAIMAQALGLSLEEFDAANEDGTALRDLLADITPADLQERMQSAVEDAVQQAVEDNVITAEQAALVLERLQDGLDMRGAYGDHHGFGGHRGFGGRGYHDFHGFRGAPQSDEDGEAIYPFRSATPFGA